MSHGLFSVLLGGHGVRRYASGDDLRKAMPKEGSAADCASRGRQEPELLALEESLLTALSVSTCAARPAVPTAAVKRMASVEGSGTTVSTRLSPWVAM